MTEGDDSRSAIYREQNDAAQLLRDEARSETGRVQASDISTVQGDHLSGTGARMVEFGGTSENTSDSSQQTKAPASQYAVLAQEFDAEEVYTVDTPHDYASELGHIDAQDQPWRPDGADAKEVANIGAGNRFEAHVMGNIKDQVSRVVSLEDDIANTGEADEDLAKNVQSQTDSLIRAAQKTILQESGGAAAANTQGIAVEHTAAVASENATTKVAAVKAAASARYASAASMRLAGSGEAAVQAANSAIKGMSIGGVAAGTATASPWILAALAILALFALILVGSIGCMTLLGGQDDSTGTLTGNQAIVASYLLGKGLDKTHVAAIMGNMEAESGINPSSVESNGNGHGLCQWSFGRYTQLREYAAAKGKTWEDIQIQLDFLWAELTGDGEAAAYANVQYSHTGFLELSDLDECVMYFGRNFERPNEAYANWKKRKESARRYFEALSSGGSAISWAMAVAADNSIGYSWGCARPGEYDCQGFVKAALIQAGENVSWSYTGDMAEGLIAAGYKQHLYMESELQPGDILLYHFASGSDYSGHTALYLGDGLIVEAISDNDGVAGDSDGKELRVAANWANGLWQNYFRKAS